MAYKRKTRDVWCIDTNYGYGWETESEYTADDYPDPKLAAHRDAREYALIAQSVRVIKRRERI